MAIAVAADGVELVQTWDKTFPKSDKVCQVTVRS